MNTTYGASTNGSSISSYARKFGRHLPRGLKSLLRRIMAIASNPGPTVPPPAPPPIQGYLDSPQDSCTIAVSESLWVAGWAYSPKAGIEKVEALFDGVLIGELEYGVERPDVATSLGLTESDRYGFAGAVSLNSGGLGSKALTVVITDKQGNTVEHTCAVVVEAVTSQPKMWIDSPRPRDVIGDCIIVGGWIYDPLHRPFEVRVLVDGKVAGTVSYGLERRDIYEMFQTPQSARAGFWGAITLTAAPHGQQPIVIQAYNSETKKVIIEAQVEVQVVRQGEPLAEIDRVVWRGDTLEVEGWALWPAWTRTEGRRRARIFLDEEFLGEAFVHLSRRDVAERFPTHSAAVQSGFRFMRHLSAPDRPTRVPGNLTVEFEDGGGRLIQKSIHVFHKAGNGQQASAIRDALAPLVEECRERLGQDPNVLDWNTGLELAKMFPQLMLISPPGDIQRTDLPYLDQSIDIVVVASTNPSIQAEAQRVCAVSVATVGGPGDGQKPDTVNSMTRSDGPIQVWWRPDLPPSKQLPSASIVIAAFNKIEYTEACIRQVVSTLPSGVDCEIIVVDDMSTDDTPEVLQRLAAEDDRIKVIRNEVNSGFLISCNTGVDAARGDVIVLLNNDTLPQPGWLSALLRTLRDTPDAGAVGGKLIYPDGSLQEAGGVVFSDGSAANYGRGDPAPDAPLYSYLREVDYCTGALLATWRKFFQDLEGFDLRYNPAYYEETDYCFKVREAGYKVYYQPESRVIHFEGVTNGTDLSSGLKSYQVANHLKFAERWRTSLTRQAPPPENYELESLHRWAVRRERELPLGKRRALVYAPRMPEFDREAGSKRLFDQIRMLRELGWAVSFVAENAKEQERYFRPLQQMGVATYAGPSTNYAGDEYLASIEQLTKVGSFDIALIAFWNNASRLIPLLRSLSPQTRIIVDSVDLQLLRQARKYLRKTHNSEPGLLDGNYADRMIGELNTYAHADAVLTVSCKEADLINDFTSNPELSHAIPLIESMPVASMPFDDRRGIVFVGNFRHPPNIEAVEYLCGEIVPLLDPDLLARHPIAIVGNYPTDEVIRAAKGLEHVRIVGWVPSIVPYLHQSRVAVAPLLHGAGTKQKLIQAIVSGMPIVSTSIGIEGLNLRIGHDVLVADTPEAFANAITQLLTNSGLWAQLALSGLQRVADAHHPDTVRAKFEQAIATIMSRASMGYQFEVPSNVNATEKALARVVD